MKNTMFVAQNFIQRSIFRNILVGCFVVFGMLGLFAGPHDAHADLVQRNSQDMGSNTSVQVSLGTNVDTSHSFILTYLGVGNENNPYDFQIEAYFDTEGSSVDHFTLARYGSDTGITVYWQVVEMDNISVTHSNNISFGTSDTSQNESISISGTNKAFAIVTGGVNTSTAADAQRGMFSANITSTSNCTVERGESGTAAEASLQVVEFTDSTTVEHQSVTASSSTNNTTISSVDTSVAFVVYSVRADTDALSTYPQVYLSGSTTLAVNRAATENNAYVEAYVVNMSGASTEIDTGADLDGGTNPVTISNVTDTDTAFTVFSMGNSGNGTTWRNQLADAALTSTTNVDVYKYNSNNTTPYAVQTVQLPYSGSTISISGTADGSDTATVKVAINGSIQGQTGTISSGSWTISDVTEPTSGDVVTVWIDSVGDSAEAAAITKYAGVDIDGMVLNAQTLSIGSDDDQTISNDNISQYDNSVSSNEDIFYDVDSNADLTVCSASGSTGCTLSVLSGNTYRPDSGSSGNITAEDLSNSGTLTLDGNTLYVSGSLTSSGTFNANTSTVNFNGTSSQTIPALDYYDLTSAESGTLEITNLESGTTASDPTTTGNLSWSAGSRGIVVVASVGSGGGYTSGEVTVTGGSVTWTEIGFVSYGIRRGLYVFFSSDTPTNGTLSIDDNDAAGTFQELMYSIEQVTGFDTSTPYDTPVTGSAADNLTLGDVGTPDTGDAIYSTFAHEDGANNFDFTAGITELARESGGTNVRQLITGYEHDESMDETPGATSDGGNNAIGGIAFIINQSASGGGGDRTLASSGTIGIAGTFTPGDATYTVTGSTVQFNGSSSQTVNADFTYSNLQVEPSANSITTNFAAGTVTVNGDLTIGNGTNTSVTVDANNASTTLTVTGSMTINTNTTFGAHASNVLTIGDDFTNNGTFTHNNGSVVFNNASNTSTLTYASDTTFYDLTISTAGKAMQFDETQGTIVTHSLTIQGTDCTTGRVFLDSTTNDNQWDITVTGATVNIDYADIEDSNAVTTSITADNSTADNDNNTNWTVNGGVCGGNTISISGSANGSDTETVKVAINGSTQGQTGTISSGSWTISDVTEPTSGDVVTVWIDSVGDSAEAAAITKYAGVDIDGMVLNAQTLSIGSDDNQTISNDNISQYDNSVSSNEDIFYDVDSNADLTVCSASGSTGCTLSVLSGNTYRPDSGSSGNITAEDLSNSGTLTLDGNTLYVSGSLTSSGTFNANTSTVNFNGTSSQIIPALDYYNLVGSSGSGGSVQFDNANLSVITDASLDSASGSHTVPSGTDLLVVMLQGWVVGETVASEGDPPSSIVWNNGSGNQNLTRIPLSTDWSYSQHGLWYLENPNVGAGGTITISGGDSTVVDGGIIHVFNLSGVDTAVGTSGIRDSDDIYSNSNTTITLSPTTASTDLIIAQWSQQASTSTTGQTYGGTSGTQNVEDGTGYNTDAAFLTTSQPTGSGQNVTFLENGSGDYPSGAAISVATSSASPGSRTLASSGTIGIAGTFTPGDATYTVTGSTVNFNGSSTQTVNADFTYNNLQVEPSANSVTTNFAAGTVTVNGDLTIGNGTNTSVIVNANNASTTLTIGGSVTINANTTFGAHASNTLTIGDDFTNNGTFTNNNGSVVFNNASNMSTLTYASDTTFYDLTISTGGKAIQFDETQGTIVTNTLTIQGTGCTTGRIFLDSTTNDNQWDITVTGATVDIDYADIEDANAVTTSITAENSTADNDNNTNWTVNGGVCGSNNDPNSPASLTQKDSGDSAITESAWTTTNTPKLGFTITDPDSDTVKYEVQVATDSGFSSLVLDYTHGSFSASGTTFEFVVGTYGSGSCTGTCPATLSDSATGYWWRVKAIDDNSAESAYVEFGVAGTMDFKVDATAPTGGAVNDGTSGDQDWNDGTLTELAANWSSFDANVSGLSKYEYAARRMSDDYYWNTGTSAWQSGEVWYDNSTTTSVTVSSMNLQTEESYYFSVRATDNAGNVGSDVDSDGQQIAPTLSFSLSGNAVTFADLNDSNSWTDTKTVTTTVSTNASGGYTIKAYNTQDLTSLAYPTETVSDFSGSWSFPASWGGGQYGFGYTSNDTSVQGSNRFSGGTAYAAFTQTPPGDVVADHTDAVDGSTGAVSGEQFTITYKVAVDTSQPASAYQTSSIYIVTANY